MKKWFLIVLAVFFLGCTAMTPTDVQEDWAEYDDPEGRFSFSYPADWVITESSDEIQLWDHVDENQSIKMVLYDHDGLVFETIGQELSEPPLTEYVSDTVNDVPVVIKMSEIMGEHTTYFYALSDGDVVSLAAYFNEATEAVHVASQQVQRSFEDHTREE